MIRLSIEIVRFPLCYSLLLPPRSRGNFYHQLHLCDFLLSLSYCPSVISTLSDSLSTVRLCLSRPASLNKYHGLRLILSLLSRMKSIADQDAFLFHSSIFLELSSKCGAYVICQVNFLCVITARADSSYSMLSSPSPPTFTVVDLYSFNGTFPKEKAGKEQCCDV